jgi:hypothetical protein
VIKKTTAVLAWLTVSHALLGGLYWLLLLVPESNVVMLATSLLLVVALVLGFGFVEGVALMAMPAEGGIRSSLLPAARRAWLVIAPLFVFGLVWWSAGVATARFDAHWSEIDAWIILKTGWTNATFIHTAHGHMVAFIREGIGTLLALTVFATVLASGLRGLASFGWIRRAFSWRPLLATFAALGIGVLFPSDLIYWRWLPSGTSASWFEPAFAAAKLSVAYLFANVGWMLLVTAVGQAPSSTATHPAAATPEPITPAQ